MVEDRKEHRRYPRIPAEFTVLVKHLGQPDDEGIAKTKSVGVGGCSFIHDEPLGRGTVVEVLISMHGEVVRATARVVNEVVQSDSRFEEHMEFLFISDVHRQVLERLLERKRAARRNP
jgi:hypothetical protein